MEFRFGSEEKPETSCSSSADSSTSRLEGLSDEEVILASNNPKKPAGRRVFRETRHPVFRGVRRRNNGKWVCELREPKTKARIWLGTYPRAEMAARAHDVAALALRGKEACLNFADSKWRLPKPSQSNDVGDIKIAAALAAWSFEVDGGCGGGEATKEKMDDMELEDEVDTPLLIARIAETPLLSPRPFCAGNVNYVSCDDTESSADMSLWNFCI